MTHLVALVALWYSGMAGEHHMCQMTPRTYRLVARAVVLMLVILWAVIKVVVMCRGSLLVALTGMEVVLGLGKATR
jgi:hypothetical protein